MQVSEPLFQPHSLLLKGLRQWATPQSALSTFPGQSQLSVRAVCWASQVGRLIQRRQVGAARLTGSQTSRYPLLEAVDAPLAKYPKIGR